MKNILLISNIYPMPDKSYSGTPVCHYFTKEWQEMGYNVKVVHFESLFPRIFYWIGNLFSEIIKAKTGCVAYTKTPRKHIKYNIDNIPVLFVPIFKMIPHSKFSDRRMKKAMDIVYKELENENFIPDIITGHFVLPQLQIIYYLKQKYSDSKTCLVLHSAGSSIPKLYPDYKTYFDNIDIFGFRSEAFKNEFNSLFGKRINEFICYSGIPEKYIQNIERDFSKGIYKFSFLGSLFKLKRVEDTLHSLESIYSDKDFSFDIIGDGAEKNNLISLTKSLNIENNVTFHGQVDRNKAQSILGKTDCFIMVSSREAFGLVYIEAMAKGCIVIGTRGQGIDGVIKHGENGFLCESSNVDELTNLIKEIRTMSKEELEMISNNAIKTAKNMTNRKVAEHYINSIINY